MSKRSKGDFSNKKQDPDEIRWKKERYYFLGDVNGRNRVTICLIEDWEGNISRGVSVCSLSDKFNNNTGMDWAYGYAMDAITWQHDSNPIRRERCKNVLKMCDFEDCPSHSHFNPELSGFELAFLKSKVVF